MLYKLLQNLQTFPHVSFFIFASLNIGLLLLYQFVNLLGRFVKRVFYSILLLHEINRAGFAGYLTFYTAYPDLGNVQSKNGWSWTQMVCTYLLISYYPTLATDFQVLYHDIHGSHDACVWPVLWVTQQGRARVRETVLGLVLE